MNKVSTNLNCYGCGVCAVACPTRAISIKLNAEGFYHPNIIDDKCVDCGMCKSVCSFLHEDIKCDLNEIQSYASWSLNPRVRQLSSSGGVTHEIVSDLLNKGYKACLVRYNIDSHLAEHYIAESVEDLESAYGSKYIQSYTPDALFKLDLSDKYVVVGTPCMIDSLKRFAIKKKVTNNFIFIDFFCHGVPSYLLWDKYIKYREHKCGRISNVIFRYKNNGWQDSLKLCITGDDDKYVGGINQKDIFYKLFLGDYCLGKACYHNCKFKMEKSSADIRVGDMWGQLYKDNKEGVSAVLAMSRRGYEILTNVRELHLQAYPLMDVSEGQMQKSPIEPNSRKLILRALSCKSLNFHKEKVIVFIASIYRKLLKIITRPDVVIRNRFMK